nr:MAG TPA: hypothetical protein [Caudoviricetes sp.]
MRSWTSNKITAGSGTITVSYPADGTPKFTTQAALEVVDE